MVNWVISALPLHIIKSPLEIYNVCEQLFNSLQLVQNIRFDLKDYLQILGPPWKLLWNLFQFSQVSATTGQWISCVVELSTHRVVVVAFLLGVCVVLCKVIQVQRLRCQLFEVKLHFPKWMKSESVVSLSWNQVKFNCSGRKTHFLELRGLSGWNRSVVLRIGEYLLVDLNKKWTEGGSPHLFCYHSQIVTIYVDINPRAGAVSHIPWAPWSQDKITIRIIMVPSGSSINYIR